jgi:hypothetical protein
VHPGRGEEGGGISAEPADESAAVGIFLLQRQPLRPFVCPGSDAFLRTLNIQFREIILTDPRPAKINGLEGCAVEAMAVSKDGAFAGKRFDIFAGVFSCKGGVIYILTACPQSEKEIRGAQLRKIKSRILPQ